MRPLVDLDGGGKQEEQLAEQRGRNFAVGSRRENLVAESGHSASISMAFGAYHHRPGQAADTIARSPLITL